MQINELKKTSIVCLLRKYFGWRNWAVFRYNSIAENMFLIFYICLVERNFTFQFIISFTQFFGFSVVSTTYGYLINDFADRDIDRLQGKGNTFEKDSTLTAICIVAGAFALSCLFGAPFSESRHFVFLFALWMTIATFYSLKPLRLKERGFVGLIVVVIAQRALPVIITFSAFNYFDTMAICVFTSYIFFRGLSSDLNHQLEDLAKDKTTKTTTFAVARGESTTYQMFRWSLRIERVLLLICLLYMLITLTEYRFLNISLLWIPLIAYAVCLAYFYVSAFKNKIERYSNPFGRSSKGILQFLHHSFPTVILSGYLLALMVIENTLMAYIMVFFIFYWKLLSLNTWKDNFIIKFISTRILLW